MTRGRINVAATVPDTGASKVSANVIVIWDDGTPVGDIEEAIKAAARKAVLRVREVHADLRPQPPYERIDFARGGYVHSDGAASFPAVLPRPLP